MLPPIIQTTHLLVVKQQLSEEVLLDRSNLLALLDQIMLHCQRLKRRMLLLMLAEELWEHLLSEHHTVAIHLEAAHQVLLAPDQDQVVQILVRSDFQHQRQCLVNTMITTSISPQQGQR
jgi:hypothetical protein